MRDCTRCDLRFEVQNEGNGKWTEIYLDELVKDVNIEHVPRKINVGNKDESFYMN